MNFVLALVIVLDSKVNLLCDTRQSVREVECWVKSRSCSTLFYCGFEWDQNFTSALNLELHLNS